MVVQFKAINLLNHFNATGPLDGSLNRILFESLELAAPLAASTTEESVVGVIALRPPPPPSSCSCKCAAIAAAAAAPIEHEDALRVRDLAATLVAAVVVCWVGNFKSRLDKMSNFTVRD